jgi:prepilin-type processing-associated H-X9-DG protein/prepilin-type N-terminal cleavage/methylation domain-containing protein
MPRRRAFTLVELLVVIGIISVLISIVFPAATRIRQRAQAVVCMSNLRQIGIGLTAYREQTRYYPACFVQIGLTFERYTIWAPRLRSFLGGNQAVFHCPSRDGRSIWTTEAPSAKWPRANKFYTGFGYELDEPLLDASSPFSYGYNAGWGYGHGGIETGNLGLGALIWADPEFDSPLREIRAGKIKVPSEMVAIADSKSDGPMPAEIRWAGGWVSEGIESIYGPVGRIHSNGANILFCDGHVQWILKNYINPDDLTKMTADDAERLGRIWYSDQRPIGDEGKY